MTLTPTALLRRGGAAARDADDAYETEPAGDDELAEDTVYPPPGGAAPAPTV